MDQNLIRQYIILSGELKELKRSIKEEYKKDSDYCELLDNLKADKECVASRRNQLNIGSLALKDADIKEKTMIIKKLKDDIKAGVMIVDKETNQQLTLPF